MVHLCIQLIHLIQCLVYPKSLSHFHIVMHRASLDTHIPDMLNVCFLRTSTFGKYTTCGPALLKKLPLLSLRDMMFIKISKAKWIRLLNYTGVRINFKGFEGMSTVKRNGSNLDPLRVMCLIRKLHSTETNLLVNFLSISAWK